MMTENTSGRPWVLAAIKDAVVMLDVELAFDAAGYSVFSYRPGVTTQQCLARLKDCIMAVIDPDIGWCNVAPLANVLRTRQIPAVVFAYGSSEPDVPDWLASAPRIEKPFRSQSLVEQIVRLDQRSTEPEL